MAYNWHRRHKDDLTFGQRSADVLRNGMGSWGFIFGALLFLAGWIVGSHLGLPIDNPQLTILNLLLSCLAALQGGILLIAAKRQDAIASAQADHDYQVNVAAEAEVRELRELLTQALAALPTSCQPSLAVTVSSAGHGPVAFSPDA